MEIGQNPKSYLTPSVVLRVLAGIALFVACLPHRYWYYVFLRIGIFCVSIYLIYFLSHAKKAVWIVGFLLVGLIFNPFLPLKQPTKVQWCVINTFSGLLFLISIPFIREPILVSKSKEF